MDLRLPEEARKRKRQKTPQETANKSTRGKKGRESQKKPTTKSKKIRSAGARLYQKNQGSQTTKRGPKRRKDPLQKQ